MSTARKPVAAEAGRLRSAILADIELDHLERMVQYVTSNDASKDRSQLDREYWGRRLRTLVETHDLVAPQRRRVIALLDRLDRETAFNAQGRSAA